MYAAMRSSLSPFYFRGDQRKSPDLEQVGQKMVLLPKPTSARRHGGVSSPCLLRTKQESARTTPVLSRDQAHLLPSSTMLNASRVTTPRGHKTETNEDDLCSDRSASGELLEDRRPIQGITIKGTKAPKTSQRSTHRCMLTDTKKAMLKSKAGTRRTRGGNDEWEMLNTELRGRVPDTRQGNQARGGRRPTKAVIRPVSVQVQLIPIDGKTSSLSLTPEKLSVRTDESTLPSPKPDGDNEKTHCWACQMDGRQEVEENGNGPHYSVHSCGKRNLGGSLSQLCHDQDHPSEEHDEPIITLDQVIEAAKRLSVNCGHTDTSSRCKAPDDDATARRSSEPVLSPEFSRKLLDSDEEGAGRIAGIPPISVSTSDGEESKELKEKRRKALKAVRMAPAMARKDTLDSTDEEAVHIRRGPPADLEEDSDKELECVAKRSAYRMTRYQSSRSSYDDMTNVNFFISNQMSWSSTFSLPLPGIRSRWSGTGMKEASFVGSLSSGTEEEG